MPLTLTTPETTTAIISTIVITEIINSPARERFIVRYNKLLDDGSVASRETFRVSGKANIQALYAELEALIQTGKTFEVASKELLYGKISTGTIN